MRSFNAQRIKEALDLKAVMTHYGVEFNRNGFAKCCFHKEKTASLSVKDGYFKCFGCGAGGDVIAFTTRLFGISFAQALVRLDNDFRLGVLSAPLTQETLDGLRRARQLEKADLADRQAQYMKNTLAYRAHWWAIAHLAPKTPSEPFNDRYVAALKELPVLDYWFDTHGWPRG